MQQRPHALASFAVPCLTIGLAVLLFFGAQALPPARFEPMGPAGLPYLVSAALFVLGLVDLMTLLRSGPSDKAEANVFVSVGWPLVGGAASILGYVILLQSELVGFVTASALFLVAMGAALARNLKREALLLGGIAVALSLGTALLLTRVLVVVLPGSGAMF